MGVTDVIPVSTSEVEVMAKPTRRRFTAEYKLRVLREAEGCSRPGEIGALLRREGLYASSLTHWRTQRQRGELRGLMQKRRGPMPRETHPLVENVKALERENARLWARAEQAEGLVELIRTRYHSVRTGGAHRAPAGVSRPRGPADATRNNPLQ